MRRSRFNSPIFASASLHAATSSAVLDVSSLDGLSLAGTWKGLGPNSTGSVSGTLQMYVSNDPQQPTAYTPTFIHWSAGDIAISGSGGSFAASFANPYFQFAKWTWTPLAPFTGSGDPSASTVTARLAGVSVGS